MGKPENTRHTWKYPKYPKIPESTKDTRKYPIVNFNTPSRPEPDPLPGILSNTRPDPILKNPARWALILVTGCGKISLAHIANCIYLYMLVSQTKCTGHIPVLAAGRIP